MLAVEAECRELATSLGQRKVGVSLVGVGSDWNEPFIRELADLSGGEWGYIDGNDAGSALRVFVEQFESLASAGFLDVEMHVRTRKEIKIKRVRQVVPDIRELPLTEPEERLLIASLGTLEKDKSPRYILDLSLPKRPDGKFKIAEIEITYDIGRGRESTGLVALEVTYGQQGHVNAEVARHIDEVQIFEANKNLQQAIAANDTTAAVQAAKIIEKKAEVMGPRAAKKALLAREVLNEIHATGRVSRKAQQALDEAAREAGAM